MYVKVCTLRKMVNGIAQRIHICEFSQSNKYPINLQKVYVCLPLRQIQNMS